MYSLSQLRRATENPQVFLREANRLYHRRLYRRNYNTAGVDIFEEDWDTLVILDGCRRDLFEEITALPGHTEHRTSRGSTTVEFLHGNVADRELLDTVYVTANPQFYRHRDELNAQFYETVDVWKESGWDETYGTVLPETVTERAVEAVDRHPRKRLVVHYIQPHYPFLTEETTFDKGYLETEDSGKGDFWSQLFTGSLDVEPRRLRKLYADNLDRAIPHVEQLLDELSGRTVVTSDHGNMLGERAFPVPITEWGHPEGLYTPQLVDVPWHVVESGPRREHVPEEPTESDKRVSDSVVAERLESLGYV